MRYKLAGAQKSKEPRKTQIWVGTRDFLVINCQTRLQIKGPPMSSRNRRREVLTETKTEGRKAGWCWTTLLELPNEGYMRFLCRAPQPCVLVPFLPGFVSQTTTHVISAWARWQLRLPPFRTRRRKIKEHYLYKRNCGALRGVKTDKAPIRRHYKNLVACYIVFLV